MSETVQESTLCQHGYNTLQAP